MTKQIMWKDELATGIEMLDIQHKVLFDLANDLNNAYQNNAGGQVIDTMFNVIQHYSFKHFETEEDLLRDEEDYLEHCYQHYQLLKELNFYAVEFRNRRKLKMAPGTFLEQWLYQHIGKSDLPDLEKVKPVADLEVIDDFETFNEEPDQERREFKRIRSESVVDKTIVANCYNASNFKRCKVTVIDMAPGGLRIHCDEKKFAVDDLLIIKCKIGGLFYMEEKVKVAHFDKNYYGVEFITPSKETIKFFTELYGAIHHNKSSYY